MYVCMYVRMHACMLNLASDPKTSNTYWGFKLSSGLWHCIVLQ